MKILAIDNYESSDYNIVQYINELGTKTIDYRNDQTNLQKITKLKPIRIILSPDTGTPEDEKDSGIYKTILQTINHNIPTMDDCLDHHGMTHNYDGKITHAKKPTHNKNCTIKHSCHPLSLGAYNPFSATRYPSLIGERDSLTNCLQITAEPLDDDKIMAIQHIKYTLSGVQFHPETIMCQNHKKIIQNFLEGTNL